MAESVARSAALSSFRRFANYDCDVDPQQGDKATELILCSSSRPHMRAFHCAWWSFFVAFFNWFAIVPLLPAIQDDLELSSQNIVWTSAVVGVASTVAVRVALGPLCDVYGPRVLLTAVLCLTAIPTALTGVLVRSGRSLIVTRAFIGIAGGAFVMSQYWGSRMFSKEIVGTANALIGGWGNLGAGVTQTVIGSYLLPLFTYWTGSASTAWRTVCIIPAVASFVTGVTIYYISDDTPHGNLGYLRHLGLLEHGETTTAAQSFGHGVANRNTWILCIQYACCFGVELTMNQAASLYFRDEFDQTPAAASAIASIFGWLNLFARGLGGFLSDMGQYKYGMRGRIAIQTFLLLAEGGMVWWFQSTTTLLGAIGVLVFFSLLVQAAEGTTFAIVPYVSPLHMGSVCGIVGAGGNVGAVAFGLAFREWDYDRAFRFMATAILISSVFSVLLHIPGHRTLLGGRDVRVDPETGSLQRRRSSQIDNNSSDADALLKKQQKRQQKTTVEGDLDNL